jgi:hypothetical protein
LGVSRFSITVDNKHNKIILEPYAEIPAQEKWLFSNKSALNKVKQGLKDAAAAHVSKRGSFKKYAKESDE